ncbi:phosphoadenylyl-sulfate reductase [candidate division BRC1 bacterium HGW-BRC1-1]|jgi:phosphoadenosine phosphosulfate reductase|nr:MAG: phosphoadenylyl-sulfate reductase [candidate division BRC1 bacterium HGW-BRC1-1]
MKPLDLESTNPQLASRSPEQILQWAVDTFGERLAVQSSMQKSAGMIMHLISRIAPDTEIVFIDTGVHFPETLAVRDEFIQRFGVNIRTYAPSLSFEEQRLEFGRDLYKFDGEVDGPGYQKCCELRKEMPYLAAVKGRFDAVVGGLMRGEGGARGDVKTISPDPRIDAYKIYPLAFITEEEVDAYNAEHNLPAHPLYARGFTSIGCSTCTTPVAPGESRRAGRWRHIREANPELAGRDLYCGINFDDKNQTDK